MARRADAGGVEIEILQIWLPSCSDQEMRTFNRLCAAIHTKDDPHLRQCAADFGDFDAGSQLNALARERIKYDSGAFSVIASQRRCRFQHCDL